MRQRSLILLVILLIGVPLWGEERSDPIDRRVQSVPVRFNGDYLKAHYRIIDVRTPEEKERNRKDNRLGGSVIVFFHGHARGPGDLDVFIHHLARRSRSGIVVFPVCDTPFGRDPRWRGDEGKMVVLMEVTRFVLQGQGMDVEGFRPLTELPVKVGDKPLPQVLYPDKIPVKLFSVGYSHGGILSRLTASRYPDAVTDLAQITPAGYEHWGRGKTSGGCCLLGNFSWESLRIGGRAFRGEGRDVWESGWGATRGFSGDCLRSCSSCLLGNFHPAKPLRPVKDVGDCAVFLDDHNAPVPRLRHVTVLFGRRDTLFEYANVGLKDPDHITPAEKDRFWQTYYPSLVGSGARLTLRVMPGNHIGLQTHYRQYAEAVLEGADQLRRIP